MVLETQVTISDFFNQLPTLEIYDRLYSSIMPNKTNLENPLQFEQVDMLLTQLKETPTAGQLIDEFFNLSIESIEGSLFLNITDDFSYIAEFVMNGTVDPELFLDEWITQTNTNNMINDVIQCLD